MRLDNTLSQGMVGEPVEERCDHLRVAKDARPFAEGEITDVRS
jgi:hypothetical protein